MSKRKPLDKVQIRERRDRMLEAAAAADLSLTDGVREMRAIAGMTQEEFARHRGVSARVIKAIELGQGNPTVATLNRIGQFFGLEVAFVPVRRATQSETRSPPADGANMHGDDTEASKAIPTFLEKQEALATRTLKLDELIKTMDASLKILDEHQKILERLSGSPPGHGQAESLTVKQSSAKQIRTRKKGTPQE